MDTAVRILVVDDDDVDRKAIRRALYATDLCVEIEEAIGDEPALEALARDEFDCVFLDYLLPGTDGMSILRAIRAADNHVPIIMLTGHGDERLAVDLIHAGASDYLPKEQISPAALSRSIASAIRVRRAELERLRAEDDLRQSNDRLHHVLESISDAFLATDKEGRFTYINQQAEKLLGNSRQELVGESIWETLPESAGPMGEQLRKAIGRGHPTKFEWHLAARGLWLDTHIYPHAEGMSAYFHDVTDRKAAEERLVFQANHDALTELPNRMLLTDRLDQVLARAPWQDRFAAVLFCDLDRFKVINDSLGHATGDDLLKLVAKRLVDTARSGDTVARLGGDEFVIVLVDVANAEDVSCVADKLLEALTQPFLVGDRELHVTASIGISLFPTDGPDGASLVKNADTAMYRAKENGKNRYEFYAPVMGSQADSRLTLEGDLRRALRCDELRLHYQPLVSLQNGEIVGTEALVRWEHGSQGLLSPDKFLPMAEETGLIVPVGEWVLHTACEQNKTWNETGLLSAPISVNLSNRQFKQENLLVLIQRALNETGLAPTLLELELTETIIMERGGRALEYLHALRDIGVRLSIDDFGTGYSSLAHLKRLPLNALKIDRSFINDVTSDANVAAIISAILAMAQKMNLEVVAEGVETREQMTYLHEHGCDRIQGYLVSKPISAEAYTQLLGEWRQTGSPESAYPFGIGRVSTC